ncbi:MAG: hypothetical protein Q7R92_03760 [bacterium]|nr:hypothetical protein [bacterium]
MSSKHKKINLVIILFILSLAAVNFCSAAGPLKPDVNQNIYNQAQKTGDAGGYDTGTGNTLFSVIQIGISAFLGLIGVILLIYMLYAGYNWMTARGDEEKVTKAKDTLNRAIIGAIIIIAAYAISVFIMSKLEQGTLKGGSNPENLNSAFE